MAYNIKTPKDFESLCFKLMVKKNPIEVKIALDEIKAKQLFEHKEYYSRLNSKIRNIHKEEEVENDLIDELSKKIEGIYLELM
tara:strand:+ start:243 stop:491 length:249 start_codon:yes stop_codon:yes gene_type:complete